MDKLPPFNRETGNGKPVKKFLNVSIVRGKHDECFNCHDLKKKMKTQTSNINKLTEQIKQYQAMIGEMKKPNQKQKEEENLDAESQGGAAGKDAGERETEEVDSGRKEREEAKQQGRAQGEGVQEAKQQKKEGLRKEEDQRGEEQEKERAEQMKKKESEEQKHERERNLRQSRERPKKRPKDNSKLCNRYVWSGECRGEKSWCRYTHKTLCKQLKKEGECTNDECRDGHNTDGICREYNKGNCRYGSEQCRLLHIKIRKQGKSEKPSTISEGRDGKERKDDQRKRVDFQTGDDDDKLEVAERKDVECPRKLAKRNDAKLHGVRDENEKRETEDSGRRKSKGSKDTERSDRCKKGQDEEGRR